MNVLIVGNGGREHALAWKIKQSPRAGRVFVAPGNAGTEIDAENVDISATDFPRLIKFAQQNEVGLTVVGPELPLTKGIVDAFSDAKLRVFGAAPVRPAKPSEAYAVPPSEMVPVGATNYRRWWNNPWLVVEKGGQRKAGAWTAADNQRLGALVRYAHSHGLWMRFYTLNGASARQSRANGWEKDYSFGSLKAVQARWKAEAEAGVDYMATDQYEDLGAFLKSLAK